MNFKTISIETYLLLFVKSSTQVIMFNRLDSTLNQLFRANFMLKWSNVMIKLYIKYFFCKLDTLRKMFLYQHGWSLNIVVLGRTFYRHKRLCIWVHEWRISRFRLYKPLYSSYKQWKFLIIYGSKQIHLITQVMFINKVLDVQVTAILWYQLWAFVKPTN